MLDHLAILTVILPLLGAPLCLLLPRPRWTWGFCCAVATLTLATCLGLFQQVLTEGIVVYELGGWRAPWGIEYRVDALNASLLVLVAAMGALTVLAAPASIESELAVDCQRYFYVLLLLCQAGLMGILATGDAFNVFVFLEISALASYTLIALGRDRRALWASYQYLIMGTIGATFILIGIGLMYEMTGTLNMADLAERLPGVAHTRTIYTAFAFFLVGVCLKLALFPLHLWLPNAYAFAPSLVTVFLAATATKVALYVLLRFVGNIFGFSYSFEHFPLQSLFLCLGIAGIFVASVMAICQTNVKRMFAFSSVAQIAYMILAFGLATPAGVTATIVHLYHHALMKAAVFLALAGVVLRLGSADIRRFDGAGRQMPLTMAGLVVGGLSLIGMPLTVGFISKWTLLQAALERGWWLLALLVLLGSLLTVVYVWRVVERAYLRPAPVGRAGLSEAPPGILIPLWLLIIANLYLGIDTRWTLGTAEIASRSVLGAVP